MHISLTRRDVLIAAGLAPFATARPHSFRFLTLTMFIETSSEDTKGVVSIVRVFVPAGDGPPPHVHSREDEIYTQYRLTNLSAASLPLCKGR